jgi:hypothetical protein
MVRIAGTIWATMIRAQKPRKIHTNTPLLSSRAPDAARADVTLPITIASVFNKVLALMTDSFPVSFIFPVSDRVVP